MSRLIRVAALLRVSTSSVEQEESPENQLAYIREEIRRHHGGETWVDTGLVYEDELTGALVLDRPGIRRLLDDVTAGKIDLIAMKSIARLGRDTLGMLMLKRRLWDDLSVDLVALQDGYRASRDLELIFLIHADRAQHGRLEISRNVRTAMRQKAARGLWTSGKVPFGYIRTGRNTIAPHPETSRIAANIFELRAEGWGLTAIVDYLNNTLRVPSPEWWYRWGLRRERLADLARTDERWAGRLQSLRARYDGRRTLWRISSVATILSNTAYYGELQYYRRYWHRLSGGKQQLVERPIEEHITLPCPPIISRELWQRAQQVAVRRIGRGNPRRPDRYLLRGLVYCGTCGSRMHGTRVTSRGQERLYYICHRRKDSRTCQARAVPAIELEENVIGYVRQALERIRELSPPETDQRTDRRLREHMRKLESRLADLEDQRRYYRNEHRLGHVSREELDKELARIQAEAERTRQELHRTRSETEGSVETRAQMQRVADLARRHARLDTSDRVTLRRMLIDTIQAVTVEYMQTEPVMPPSPSETNGRSARGLDGIPTEILSMMLADPDGRDTAVAELLGANSTTVWGRRHALGIPPKPPYPGTNNGKRAFLARWTPVVTALRNGASASEALEQMPTTLTPPTGGDGELRVQVNLLLPID